MQLTPKQCEQYQHEGYTVVRGLIPRDAVAAVQARMMELLDDEPSFPSATTGHAFQRHRIPFAQIDFSKEVLLPMSPGDGAFFTNYTWHRAEPNRSGVHKCACAIAYQRQ
jgi:ectoine hydroxylase-related dioxygenase (phytanoyl-CoA dioxygenase family)